MEEIRHLFRLSNNNRLLEDLIERVQCISQVSDNLVICPSNTGYNWLGVLNATKGLFPAETLVIPQVFSKCSLNVKDQNILAGMIVKIGFKNVVFSGFPNYFEVLIKAINKRLDCHVFYHGYLGELADNSTQQKSLKLVLELSKGGYLKSIAFNKKGLMETFEGLNNISAYHLILKTPIIDYPKAKASESDGKIHIGVLVNNQFRKNPHNQVAGALLVPESIVHCSNVSQYDYLSVSGRLSEIPNVLPHNEFLRLLGLMDVNAHVTYSESWGQVITESLVMGVPCIASNTSGVFDYSDDLAELLVVKEFDNSAAIANQIKKILPVKDEIGKKGRDYVVLLNSMAEDRVKHWLNA